MVVSVAEEVKQVELMMTNLKTLNHVGVSVLSVDDGSNGDV